MEYSEALAQLRQGRPHAAVRLLKSIVHEHPTDAHAWFLLGASHHEAGELAAASEAIDRSLLLDPARVDAYVAKTAILRAGGNLTGALAAAKVGLDRIPGNSRLEYAVALCFDDLGESELALSHYDAALREAGDPEPALQNKGSLLVRLGRLSDAEATYKAHIQRWPKSVRARAGLADVLLAQERFQEALDVLEALRQMAPEDPTMRVRQGVALASLCRFDEAREVLESARADSGTSVAEYLRRISPGSNPNHMLSPENIFLGRAWAALGRCDWSRWDNFVDVLSKAARDPAIVVEPAVAFMCQHTPLPGAERHAICAKIAEAVERSTAVLRPLRPHDGSRIRVGLLSADFREHLDAYGALPLLQCADHNRFEFYAYALCADDGSKVRAEVLAAAHRSRDLSALNDHDAAVAIRHDDIDILVDLTGHKTGGRFAVVARRPARLQATYRGFSSSLASHRIDYAIVDRIAGANDLEWTEARIFLPLPYYIHDYRAPATRISVTRADYGLASNAFVYCAFHKAEKISPDVFDLWMKVLRAVPHSVLWFRALSDTASGNLRRQALEAGVDPQRLAFAPFEPRESPRYAARHRLGDLMLDSLHHNAIESACDALGAGLPVLTLRGGALASRAGESLASSAGLPDLVAGDRNEYVKLAIELGREPMKIKAMKDRLRANRHTAPLFDTAGRVRALEAAFQEMYDRMMRGEPPASFDVRV